MHRRLQAAELYQAKYQQIWEPARSHPCLKGWLGGIRVVQERVAAALQQRAAAQPSTTTTSSTSCKALVWQGEHRMLPNTTGGRVRVAENNKNPPSQGGRNCWVVLALC